MNPQNKQGQIMEMIFYKPENQTCWTHLNNIVNPKGWTDEELVASLRIKFDSETWDFERINSKMFRWNGYLVARWDNNDLDKMKEIEREMGEEMFISDYLESLL